MPYARRAGGESPIPILRSGMRELEPQAEVDECALLGSGDCERTPNVRASGRGNEQYMKRTLMPIAAALRLGSQP